MNQIDTVKYIKDSLEQIKLIGNVSKGSDKIYIKELESKTYPNMDIVLYTDIEHIDNPVMELIKPVLHGKINFDNTGCYIKLDKELDSDIQFNSVFYTFVSFSSELKDNELPSVSDVMNMVNSETDKYDGIKLVSKGIPSMINGDMKLRLSNIPYNINLKKTVTNDWNKLFLISLDDENTFDKDFSIKVYNHNLGLDLEMHCSLNEKQQIVSSTKNYSKEKYLDNTEFCFVKNQYIKINDSNRVLNLISIEMRIKDIVEEEINIEICKQKFQDILVNIENDYLLSRKEFISFSGGIDILNFNKSINFYSSEYKRENLIIGDLFRLAINLEETTDINHLTNNGIYFCSNNYGKNLPIFIPDVIKDLWYLEVKNIADIVIQTVYDLSDIKNVFQRKSIGQLQYSDWNNIYYLEHKHKTSDIEETEDKMFIDKKSIEQISKNSKQLKHVNILEPVNGIMSLQKKTDENPIEDYSMCYVRSLKTYLVFDGSDWNSIDDAILDYSNDIDLNKYKTKATIIFRDDDMLILKGLLSLKYDTKFGIVSITGNGKNCYQEIRITDINGKIHEYLRTFIETTEESGDIWSVKEISTSGHKHEITDISENEDKFFMTKEDKLEIQKIKKAGTKKVNTFLDLPGTNDIEDTEDTDDALLYLVEETKIIYSFDKQNNKWNPISVNSLSNIDEEKENVESGLISKTFYQKLKDLISNDTIKSTKNNSLFYGSKEGNISNIGSSSIDLVMRKKDLVEKLGNNSVAIGNDIYRYNNKSMLIGNNLESVLEKTVMIGNDLISNKSLFVFGNYNIDGEFAFCFGNGNNYDSEPKRSNLFTVDYDGMFETSEHGGYSIKNGLVENVLLANGKTISIYDIYKIIRKLIKSEPEGIDSEMKENAEGELVPKLIIGTFSNSSASEIFNKLLEKRNVEIINKTFSII